MSAGPDERTCLNCCHAAVVALSGLFSFECCEPAPGGFSVDDESPDCDPNAAIERHREEFSQIAAKCQWYKREA